MHDQAGRALSLPQALAEYGPHHAKLKTQTRRNRRRSQAAPSTGRMDTTVIGLSI